MATLRRTKATPESLKDVIGLEPGTIMNRFRLPKSDPLHLPSTKIGRFRFFDPDELKQVYYDGNQ